MEKNTHSYWNIFNSAYMALEHYRTVAASVAVRLIEFLSDSRVYKPVAFGICIWFASGELGWLAGWKAAAKERNQFAAGATAEETFWTALKQRTQEIADGQSGYARRSR